MSLDLENKEWKEFLFIDIFDIKKGYYNKKPKSSKQGEIPFLSASQFNNGISEFYSISEIEKASKTGDNKNDHPIEVKVFKGNCIAVTNNGSVGYAFYQETDFTCSHDINPLYLKNHTLNSILAKFLITTIEAQRVCFEYARKWRPKRMVKSKILLPTNSKGEPDYAFMEQYMRHKEEEKQKEHQAYIQNSLLQLKNTPKTVSLEEKEWSGFTLSNIFKVDKGVYLHTKNIVKGDIPFVSAKATNNGVTSFIGNKTLFKGNSITVEKIKLTAFYQPKDFYCSHDVTVLKNKYLNKYNAKFICNSINRNGSKYSYGRQAQMNVVKREKIYLPTNSNNEPDYEFMENYMKNLEYKKLNEYLEFKNK